ncbi:MAG: insulinase family protein, partial [Kiritimatiellota bacterium]|nr:insulinase family protein [Kiritimatiellota bacterium]
VILREMAMGKDNPERRVSELLWQTAYSVHPYRVPVIGYEDIFKTITRADLLAFFRRHYMPNNMIVAIVGDVRVTDVRAEVQKQFGDCPRRAYGGIVLPSEPSQIGLRTARQTGAWTVARLEWAWHTVPLSHPDAPALDLLAAIVGQGRSSSLGHSIKENKKLVSQIEAWSFTPREAGLFGISAVFDPTNEPALTQALEGEIARWTTVPFRPEEIEKARFSMLTGTLSAFQTMHGQADQFASGEFYAGTPTFFQVYLRRLRDVTPAALAGVVRRYLTPDNLTKAVLLPGDGHRTTDDGRQTREDGRQRADDGPRGTRGKRQIYPALRGTTDAGPNADVSAIALATAEHRTLNTDVQKTILASGLVLLTRADHRLPFVDFQVACGGGVIFENESNNGISSLMAETMTRGTARRSAREIAA